MGEISKLYKYSNYKPRVAKEMGKTVLYDGINKEIEKIKELVIEVDNNLRNNIVSAYLDEYYSLKSGDVLKSFIFIKYVYESIIGSGEDFNEFINSKKPYSYSSYSRLRYRLAIFNHFGLLKEVFLDYPELLVSKFFDKVTTLDIYKILSNNSFNSIEDFLEYVNNLSVFDKEKIFKQEVNQEEVVLLDRELMENLIKFRKKNNFIRMMMKKK